MSPGEILIVGEVMGPAGPPGPQGPAGSPGSGGASGVLVRQVTIPGEYDFPESNDALVIPVDPAIDVPGHNLLISAVEADFFVPTLDVNNTQDPGQIGAQVNVALSAYGLLVDGASDIDPSELWTGVANPVELQVLNANPTIVDEWQTQFTSANTLYAPGGTVDISLKAQAVDMVMHLGVIGVKMRNLVFTIAAFGAG